MSVLIIFNGPQHYISSSWYKEEEVPTWNYIAIHCTGNFRQLEGKELLDTIKKMVEHYETNRPHRYHISDMPDDMLEAHLEGLIGFEMKIKNIEANYKLSQNRNDKNYQNIITELLQSSDPLEVELAHEMQNLRPKLYAK